MASCCSAHRGELGQRGLIQAAKTVRSGLGLDSDHRHMVSDDVVHFPGDARTFFEDRPAGHLDLGAPDLLR